MRCEKLETPQRAQAKSAFAPSAAPLQLSGSREMRNVQTPSLESTKRNGLSSEARATLLLYHGKERTQEVRGGV